MLEGVNIRYVRLGDVMSIGEVYVEIWKDIYLVVLFVNKFVCFFKDVFVCQWYVCIKLVQGVY